MGFSNPAAAATDPHKPKSVMMLASHSTHPHMFKFDPFPALVKGESSRTEIAALTESKSPPPPSKQRAATSQARAMTALYPTSFRLL
jgi:hypothetical protein